MFQLAARVSVKKKRFFYQDKHLLYFFFGAKRTSKLMKWHMRKWLGLLILGLKKEQGIMAWCDFQQEVQILSFDLQDEKDWGDASQRLTNPHHNFNANCVFSKGQKKKQSGEKKVTLLLSTFLWDATCTCWVGRLRQTNLSIQCIDPKTYPN